MGRVGRTDFPDGTISKVVFTPWESTHWYAEHYDYFGGDVCWQKERRAYEHRERRAR